MRATLIDVGARKFLTAAVRLRKSSQRGKLNQLMCEFPPRIAGSGTVFWPFILGGASAPSAPEPIPYILGRDKEEKAEEKEEKSELDHLQEAGLDRSPCQDLPDGKNDVPPIQDGQWQHVKDGKIDVEEDHEPEESSPAILDAQHVEHHPADPHRAGKVLDAHI